MAESQTREGLSAATRWSACDLGATRPAPFMKTHQARLLMRLSFTFCLRFQHSN